MGREAFERARDPEVSETRLTVPSNQDVTLVVRSVNVGVHSILRSTYRTDATV